MKSKSWIKPVGILALVSVVASVVAVATIKPTEVLKSYDELTKNQKIQLWIQERPEHGSDHVPLNEENVQQEMLRSAQRLNSYYQATQLYMADHDMYTSNPEVPQFDFKTTEQPFVIANYVDSEERAFYMHSPAARPADRAFQILTYIPRDPTPLNEEGAEKWLDSFNGWNRSEDLAASGEGYIAMWDEWFYRNYFDGLTDRRDALGLRLNGSVSHVESVRLFPHQTQGDLYYEEFPDN